MTHSLGIPFFVPMWNLSQNLYVYDALFLLGHPKVRVFMSHGGLLGSSEAAYCGVPTVVTPQYGDQFVNAAALERRGMGTILSFHDMTTENILDAINKALSPR